MKYASVTERLVGLGGAKWELHLKAREMVAAGDDVIELTIGEPDVPVPDALVGEAVRSIQEGRTKYAHGQGELPLRTVLAERYARRTGRAIQPSDVLCLPGTQTALYTALMGVAEPGNEVLVGDPMYATYEAVIRSTGADLIPVPLRSAHGFRIQASDIADRITPKTSALLLTTPHNPTGAILTPDDLRAICELAKLHDFWIISDEVYAEMVFEGEEFHSPFGMDDYKDRVIVVSSISKSHAAPGFRSGWCVGSTEFIEKILPLSEAMLFGNQPFIADMTAKAVREGSPVAKGMCERFSARAKRLQDALGGNASNLEVNQPQAGMFALIKTSGTGLSGEDFARRLLQEKLVAVMPGTSFGESLKDWVRVALTVPDGRFDEAVSRIAALVEDLSRSAQAQAESVA